MNIEKEVELLLKDVDDIFRDRETLLRVYCKLCDGSSSEHRITKDELDISLNQIEKSMRLVNNYLRNTINKIIASNVDIDRKQELLDKYALLTA
jgi:hypothetical protein